MKRSAHLTVTVAPMAIALAGAIQFAPAARAQLQGPGQLPGANMTLVHHGRLVFQADIRPAGAPAKSRPELTERVEVSKASQDDEWQKYARAFIETTSQSWMRAAAPLASGGKGNVTVEITIRADGALDGDPTIVHSSGDRMLDAATETALARSAPFAPLPVRKLKKPLRFRVSFVYDHPSPPAASREP